MTDEEDREHPYSDMARDRRERLELAPPVVPMLDLLTHRHCLDCGLPVVKYTPTGTVYDMAIPREHVCPVDPGQSTTCLCGIPVKAFLTGVVVDERTGEPHSCDWTTRLGSLLVQQLDRAFEDHGVGPLPAPPAEPERRQTDMRGVLPLE